MLSKHQYFHHPFKNSSFGFLLEDNTSPANISGFVVENIDLYYQPVPNPVIALIFFFLKLSLLIIGELINAKVFVMMKKETGLLSDVTKLFVTTQMIFRPLWFLFTTGTDFIHPLNEVFGQWFCNFGWFGMTLGSQIIVFHSFIAALMRYLYIIHREKVDSYGKDKTKKLFLFLSFFIPLLGSIWTVIEDPELSILSNINKCNGKHHKVFLIETSTLHVLKRNFWEFGSYELSGSFAIILAILRRVSKIARTVLILITGFNFVEGIIYYKILSHINR